MAFLLCMNFFTTPHFLNKYAEEMRGGEKVHAKIKGDDGGALHKVCAHRLLHGVVQEAFANAALAN